MRTVFTTIAILTSLSSSYGQYNIPGDYTIGGKVGIGTPSPYSASRLHAKALSSSPWTIMSEAHNSDRVIGLSHDGNTGVIAVSYTGTSGYTPLQFWTQNIPRMTIDINGRVGIGTTSPYIDSRMHIKALNSSLWTIMAEANNNERVIGLSHDGNAGIISVSYLGTTAGYTPLQFQTQNIPRMTIDTNGNVMIAKTSQTNTAYKLDVNGSIRSNEVVVNTTGADFVFDSDYELMDIGEVEKFIKRNKHLPDIEPANEMVEKGLSLGQMDMKLLQKIEELTLYMIDFKKEMDAIKDENQKLKERIITLEKD